tara:strand:- start:368 stop:640 length:273 start_codon:yes stop_codon:yes gene_type:complete
LTLQSLTIGLVVVALVLVVGFQILASIQATLVAGTTASNATITVQNAIDTNVVGNLGLIALIAVMSVNGNSSRANVNSRPIWQHIGLQVV